jgi:hypothetical protein
MNKKSTKRKDYKSDISVRNEGYYVDPLCPIRPLVNPPEQTQADLGPLPNSGNRLDNSLVGRVGVFFSYDGGWDTTPSPQRDTMSSSYGCSFSYDGGYNGTNSDQNDTMSTTFSLTLRYL